MSNQMWLERNTKHKKIFHVKRKKCNKNFQKMVQKNLRSLTLKQYQSDDLKSFWNWLGISDFCKKFCKNFAFCVGTFIRNFRLALMILILSLNKKRSSVMHFKQIVRRFCLIQQFFSFCACGICFGVEKNVAKYSFINNTLWLFQIVSFPEF